jgi:hypothetical protein
VLFSDDKMAIVLTYRSGRTPSVSYFEELSPLSGSRLMIRSVCVSRQFRYCKKHSQYETLPRAVTDLNFCSRSCRYGNYPSRFWRDSPENALKIPRLETGLKCTAISQTNPFLIESKWQHSLATTLRAECTRRPTFTTDCFTPFGFKCPFQTSITS